MSRLPSISKRSPALAAKTDKLLGLENERVLPKVAAPENEETLRILEEKITISKREVVTGRVRVSVRTDIHDDLAEATLERESVEVVRVPVDRIIEKTPDRRIEGETTIVPVVEERLVMVKQLVLVEELHIRVRVERQNVRETIPLRRQHVVIERLSPNGGDEDKRNQLDLAPVLRPD